MLVVSLALVQLQLLLDRHLSFNYLQLVTLPVEFDAASAKAQLVGLGIVEPDEMQGVTRHSTLQLIPM